MDKEENDMQTSTAPQPATQRETETGPAVRPPAPPKSASSAPIANAVIRSKDFSLFYGIKAGVKNITLDVEPQAVTAIIGPSGCGKSTWLRSINRMNDLVPGTRAEGEILVDGTNVYDKRTNLVNLRQQVGMVFQKPNPFPKTIFDNVAFGPRLQGIRNRGELEEIVENCLRASALWDEVKDNLAKSALGPLRRPAAAPVHRPGAGHPGPRFCSWMSRVRALDPIATSRIEDLIAELKSQYTIVIVTHNMQQAARISQRTAFFCMGEMIEYGVTEKIFTNPSNKQTEDYITGRFG